jgi:quinol monooxygenase YgiN
MRLFAILISTVILGAQAPTDTTVFAVAYVDVMPAATKTAVTAFKQYREMSRKEEGFMRLEFLEQVGRTSRFAMIETWANQKALDAHAAAAHTKEWRTKLDSLRLTDYDQRPYKTITSGSPPASATDKATYVLTHVDIGGQGTKAPELLKGLADASRKEDGNLRFDILQHAMRANHFTVVEVWRNRQAQEAHAAAQHTRQFRDAVGPLSGSPLDERVYEVAQ